ncbi:peripherin-2-like [Pristis pectinata]|uniref:peripherin-2-like n=1 Tax=Pristis pectinata TaxID=685728 RepID=UPI00223DC619|nr:peripherin-2-like [Pristis pectinata]
MALLRVRLARRERARLAQAVRPLCGGCSLAAAATLGLAAHLECALRRRAGAMDDADVHLLPRALMVAGALSALVSLAGVRLCGDALDPGRLPRWKSLAGPYLALSFLLTFLTLASSPLGYLMRGSLDASLKVGLRNGIRFYKDTDTPGRCFQKRTVDLIQMEFQCCGNDGYRDWFEVQWISNRYLDFNDKDVRDRIKSNVDGRYLINSVPFSCCNPSSPRPCIQHQITNNSAHFNYEVESEELNIWMKGCREALLNYYTGTMATISTAVLLFSIVQLGVLTGLRYLSVSALAALEQSEPESDADGYLLEKGPLETVCAAAKALTSTFSSNQVQTDPAPTEEKAADK